MDAFFVILDPVIEIDITLAVQDKEIRTAAERYIKTKQKADELKADAEDRLFAGSAGTVYLKKLGHRPLSTPDVNQLIGAMGDEEDKQSLTDFADAQQKLSQRLKPLSQHIGLILEQAEVPYFQYRRRLEQVDLWKPEQMIAIVDVLDRLRV